MNAQPRRPWLWTLSFTVIALAYLYPIALVVINSFKGKVYIAGNPFSLPTAESFVGWQNYIEGVRKTDLITSFGWSLVITVGSALLILAGTSMTAWWIVRMDNRFAKTLYTSFLFNLVVPFQMVMFTLSWLADSLGLSNPFGLWII